MTVKARCSPLFLALLVPAAFAADLALQSQTPDSIRWSAAPNMPGLQTSWLQGGFGQPGFYTVRVKLAAGTRIPPHIHPDDRYTTVLSGTVYVGTGENAHDDSMSAQPAGSFYRIPAGAPHYLWARDGEVIYQEAGVGPTQNLPLRR